MSDNEIRYEKLLQRQGRRSELESLDGGELGFAYDTAQLYLGTDPNKTIKTEHNIITIYPFLNARTVVQSFLDSVVEFSIYSVRENLTIETESEDRAIEVMGFINEQNAAYFGSDAVPVANLQRNIEIITERNILEYTNPADYDLFYDPALDFSQPSKKLLVKNLDSTLGNVFLEYDITQLFHLEVSYTLVQQDGWHRRSGEISLIADDNSTTENQLGFVDDQTLYNDALHDDFIEFSAEAIGGKVRIKFIQPVDHTTKIFYRVSRWNIGGIMAGSYATMPNPEDNNILTINNGYLTVNGSNLDV